MSEQAGDWGDDCQWCRTEHLLFHRVRGHGQAIKNKKTLVDGWMCRCGLYFVYLDEWHDHLVGRERVTRE